MEFKIAHKSLLVILSACDHDEVDGVLSVVCTYNIYFILSLLHAINFNFLLHVRVRELFEGKKDKPSMLSLHSLLEGRAKQKPSNCLDTLLQKKEIMTVSL